MAPYLEDVQPVLMSRDVAASVRFFGRLGFVQTFGDADVPERCRYAGIRRDAVELHLQWQAPAAWDGTSDRPTYRIVVADVDGLREEFHTAGIGVQITRVMDTAWGTREFHVLDPDGNGLQFCRVL